MKTILLFSILFCVIAMPAMSELSDADLDKIRLIVKQEIEDEIKPINTEIGALKTDMGWTRGTIAGIDQRFELIGKQITWLMVIVGVAVGIPLTIITIIVALRSRSEQIQEKLSQDQAQQIETLKEEIEMLKQQRIVQS